MNQNVAALAGEILLEQNCLADPIVQFQQWLDDAIRLGLPEPTACNLATVTSQGRPRARMILLKGVDARGFSFFTNYQSAKGQELLHSGWATLTFFWVDLVRQIRIEGKVLQLSQQESDSYFETRPRGSQIGAWASSQSEVVESRELLENKFLDYERRFSNQKIPRPPTWGGFCLQPDRIEFWKGQPNRLHDRIVYRKSTTGWSKFRLFP